MIISLLNNESTKSYVKDNILKAIYQYFTIFTLVICLALFINIISVPTFTLSNESSKYIFENSLLLISVVNSFLVLLLIAIFYLSGRIFLIYSKPYTKNKDIYDIQMNITLIGLIIFIELIMYIVTHSQYFPPITWSGIHSGFVIFYLLTLILISILVVSPLFTFPYYLKIIDTYSLKDADDSLF